MLTELVSVAHGNKPSAEGALGPTAGVEILMDAVASISSLTLHHDRTTAEVLTAIASHRQEAIKKTHFFVGTVPRN